MNKAEEQYLYWWGWNVAKSTLMREWNQEGFIEKLMGLCKERLYSDKVSGEFGRKGWHDFYSSIIHAIDCNVITDWPSFVTYMTGEAYE